VQRDDNREVTAHEARNSNLPTRIHASNCENNAAIQEREGEHESAANSRSNASDYRQAIEALKAE
jgi:hypothetical protein